MRIHFIAIGGSAMHNLAIALQLNGYAVSGSDDEIFEPSKSRLIQYGLLPEQEGWHPEAINGEIDAIILGMHARADNPELIRAQEIGLKIYSYPEFLYYHSRNKTRIVIGGSHGKTTITGIIMHVLKQQGMDFDYLVGSNLKDFNVMVQLSEKAPIMVFEGDEYLSSPIDRRPKFHWYRPHIALLSGIAWDHINVFPTEENYVEQFGIFIDLIENNGTLIFNKKDLRLKELAENRRKDLILKGYSQSDAVVRDETTFLIAKGEEYPLKIFGSHNLMNINGAKLICMELGITDEEFYKSVSTFDGTANRLELVKKSETKYLFKDFAHAPSKVLATINAVKEQFPGFKIIACLELHTFSSLNMEFLSQYDGTFQNADMGCVYFNQHALTLKKLPALNKEEVKAAFNFDNLGVFNDSTQMIDFLSHFVENKIVFLMMSSGNFDGIDFNKLADKLFKK